MRKPTPVTTRIMTAERGSSRNSAVATKSPAAIQVNRVRTTCLSSGARWIRLSTNPAATRNETPTDPQATREMTGLGSRFPSRPFMAEPKSGSAGTSQRKSIRLPLHDVRVVHTERVPVAVDSDCNGQPDGRFCRGNHHNKEDKDLTVNLIQVAGKRDEAQVDAVQHQFDAKKNGNDIFLHDHPDSSHREEERAQNQVRENAHGVSSDRVCSAATIPPSSAFRDTPSLQIRCDRPADFLGDIFPHRPGRRTEFLPEAVGEFVGAVVPLGRRRRHPFDLEIPFALAKDFVSALDKIRVFYGSQIAARPGRAFCAVAPPAFRPRAGPTGNSTDRILTIAVYDCPLFARWSRMRHQEHSGRKSFE